MTRTLLLSVDVEDDALVARVAEVLTRHLVGLMLEGVDARLQAYTTTDEESG